MSTVRGVLLEEKDVLMVGLGGMFDVLGLCLGFDGFGELTVVKDELLGLDFLAGSAGYICRDAALIALRKSR